MHRGYSQLIRWKILLVALPTELMAHIKLNTVLCKKLLETKKWLGYQDSNLGYTGSKPDALPLGYSPTILYIWWRGRDSNSRTLRERIYSPPRLATSLPLHIVNTQFIIYSCFLKKWCRPEDLNPQPTDYKSVALPVELGRHMVEDAGLEPATPCL